tara:strand:- start:4576 stop:4773 length:198 start_codon:yes stop_codon:yes gene_type:complete
MSTNDMKTEVDVQAVISGLIEEIGQKTYEIQMLRAGLSKAQEMIAALQVEITESQESSSKTSKSK